jgi:hypothetical protein
MRLAIFVALAAFCYLAPPDVTGVWNLDMHWSGSDTHATGVCTLKQDEQKVTGSCESAKSAVTGEIDDRKVSIRIDVEQEGTRGTMTFTGTLDESGRTIEGTCRIVGGQDGTFTMKKQ